MRAWGPGGDALSGLHGLLVIIIRFAIDASYLIKQNPAKGRVLWKLDNTMVAYVMSHTGRHLRE